MVAPLPPLAREHRLRAGNFVVFHFLRRCDMRRVQQWALFNFVNLLLAILVETLHGNALDALERVWCGRKRHARVCRQNVAHSFAPSGEKRYSRQF
jgi:hypothetical protein